MISSLDRLAGDLRKLHPWMVRGLVDGAPVPLPKPAHVYFCICDHFEPLWGHADRPTGLARVKQWHERYPRIAEKYRDSDGAIPQYTFFYPAEEYRKEYLDLLAELVRGGFGEAEIHLHHHNDTSGHVRAVLTEFRDRLAYDHGLLSVARGTRDIRYGFIHGNWALDNSRPDGAMCGVNDELTVLQETGCYADFTMPSAPDVTQTRKINSIYYARDDARRPKSHDRGIDAAKGVPAPGGLLMVQGPLLFNWHNRKYGMFPKIENGNISDGDRVDADRVRLWIRARVTVAGDAEHVFVKVHTHGCHDRNARYLLGGGLDTLFSCLRELDERRFRLHYVSARQMVNIIRALEDGRPDGAGDYKDYALVRSL
jgi:hypothetical protein